MIQKQTIVFGIIHISKIRNALSLDKRCDVAKIKRFTVEIATRSFESTALFKNGRIIAIDADESWSIAIPYLVKRERELIGKTLLLIFYSMSWLFPSHLNPYQRGGWVLLSWQVLLN